MKRLTFKKPFNGMDSALKLIPESYKVDGKEFQITDGTETYNIRWDINEATVLRAENKNLINEDMNKIKHLMGFKSQDTLGNLRGEERLNENSSFTDIWDKTKNLLSESKEEVNEMVSGSANGLGFTGEGNLEGNAPIAEMEKEEDGEEKLDEFENKDVEKLFDTMSDMNKIQTLASKINTRPEKIEAAVAYVKAIIGDDDVLQKKVARILMNDKGEEQNASQELAQQANDGNMNESIREKGDRFDEIFEDLYSEEESEDFPDLTGDGKVTQADILKGRGVFEEDEQFIAHGIYTLGNAGGYEVMLSDSGDAAKVRDAYGSDNPQTSDWLEIEYLPSEDGEMEPVIDPQGYNIPLNMVMRVNR
jgi:hypothetical protein